MCTACNELPKQPTKQAKCVICTGTGGVQCGCRHPWDCHRCDGGGILACYGCDGIGVMYDDDDDYVECPHWDEP
jgi:hypothetical protein